MDDILIIKLILSGSIVMLVILLTVFIFLTQKISKAKKKSEDVFKFSNEELSKFSEVEHSIFDKKIAERQITSPDGVNPGPLSYTVINDGGRDVYVRNFTIVSLPKKIRFADTMSKISDFENAVTSVFINPMTKKESTKQLDNYINVLDGEKIHAEKPEVNDKNRVRKVSRKMRKTEAWADKIDGDEEAFYKVGFLVEVRALTLAELNIACDKLHMEATEAEIMLSGCYGCQIEAFKSNLPFNTVYSSVGGFTNPIHWFVFSKKAVAAIYNHKHEKFIHKNGVPIGLGLYDRYPVLWDPYDASHTKGFSAMFCGDTGVGKSTLMKLLSNRLCNMHKMRFVCIDSQSVGGAGEYTNPTLMKNGSLYKINRKSKERFNLFDVAPETVYDAKKKIDKVVLKLNEKKEEVLLSFLTMVGIDEADFIYKSFIKEVLTDAIREVYDDLGIIDGDVDSVYEEGRLMENNEIISGRVKKKMPTISDTLKKLIVYWDKETNKEKKTAIHISIAAISTWVEGVYYTKDSIQFISKNDYYKLPIIKEENRQYRYKEVNGKKEEVIVYEGNSPYFDGQSTIEFDPDCPFTTFDISDLPESEQKMARTLLVPYIETNFIKKNNEDITRAEFLIVMFDEAVKHWETSESIRKQSVMFTRTCRKKNVGLWWAFQACADVDKWQETRDIFKLTDVKFVFQQSRMDEEFLKKNLPLTDIQRERVYKINGTKKNGEQVYSEPGEVCLIDGDIVYFLRAQIMDSSESRMIETDMRKLAQKVGKEQMYWVDQEAM